MATHLRKASMGLAARPPKLQRRRVATPRGFEPPTYGLGNRRSIHQSYGVTLAPNVPEKPAPAQDVYRAAVCFSIQSQRVRLIFRALEIQPFT